jgi:hypothetical protein
VGVEDAVEGGRTTSVRGAGGGVGSWRTTGMSRSGGLLGDGDVAIVVVGTLDEDGLDGIGGAGRVASQLCPAKNGGEWWWLFGIGIGLEGYPSWNFSEDGGVGGSSFREVPLSQDDVLPGSSLYTPFSVMQDWYPGL